MSSSETLPARASLASSGTLTDSASAGPGASAAATSEVDQLLQWIQHHPQYRELSAETPAKPSRRQRAFAWLKQHVLANPAELHGTAYVTPATHRDSDNVARVVSTSNLVDGVGNFSLLLFAGGTNPIGVGGAIALTAILLKFDQALFTAVARGGRSGRKMAYAAAVCGLLPFALLKTLGTGVGVEVMQNQSALQLRQATALVEDSLRQERARISRIGEADPTYAGVRDQCRNGQAQLARLSHNDPRWQSLQVELFGEWSQRNRDWRQSARSTPPPVCVQQKLIEADLRSRTDRARERLNGIEQQRIGLGNDQRFLKLHYPERYSLAFQPNGEFCSTVQLVAVGLDSFAEKIRTGQMSQLGLSLYVLLVSALTSFSACLLVLMHPHRPGVAQSWDEDLRRERDRWLAEQLQTLSASRLRDGGEG